MTESIHMPMGFNYVPHYYVMDRDCYWENGKPVNEITWTIFKRLEDKQARVQLLFFKPMAFSIDLIQKTFNPVRNLETGMVIRDAVFAFRSFIENLHDEDLTLSFSEEHRSFIIGYNHLYK
jgi:hypothetical protein